MPPQSPLLVCAALLSYTISTTLGSGVLTIRLTGFKNTFGRTYDGTCCDASPKDHGSICYDQCDYVMRLIVTGLGRANDHVFLFHRPLTYDSNNIVFENGDSNLLLTVLFDEWPEDDQVKMNAFFYDYDDFDHTTTLVDWFETDLRHSTNSTGKASVGWGNFQQQTVIGNRQTDKTVLTFEWSALNEKEDFTQFTTGKSKVTATPAAEPTHITRLSTSKEATDFLRQAWTNAHGSADTTINFQEDLESEVPGLLKSVLKSLRSKKEQLSKRITEDEKPMPINTKYAPHHKESYSSSDEKIGPENDFIRSINSRRYPRRRVGLIKRKPSNSSMSTSQLFHGKLVIQNSVHEAERKSPIPDVIITTSSPSRKPQPTKSQNLQSHARASFESDDSAHLDKPEPFQNRRPFVRPRSWFNSFSDKLSPGQLNGKRQKYEGKQWGKSNDEHVENRKNAINTKNSEDDYDDDYFDRLNIKDDSYVGKKSNSGTSAEGTNSQANEDTDFNTPGRIRQHRPKSLIHRIRKPGPQDLKLNLTKSLASKFGGGLQKPQIRNSDLITLGKSVNAPRRQATKGSVFSPNIKNNNYGRQISVTAQPDFKWKISSDPSSGSTATSLPPTSSKENQSLPSLDLKTQNSHELLKSPRTDDKLTRGNLTTTNATNRSVETDSKTSVTMLKTKDLPKPSALKRIVVYKSNVTTNNKMTKDGRTGYQINKIGVKTGQPRKVGNDINDPSGFTDHLVNTDQTYLHKQNKSTVSARKNATAITRKLQTRRMTTPSGSDSSHRTLPATRNNKSMPIRPLQTFSVSMQPAKVSSVLYTPKKSANEIHPTSEQRHSTMSHQSKTQVPKLEPYASAKTFINAAAAIDRPRLSPSRKKSPLTLNNYAINNGSSLFNNSVHNVNIGNIKLNGNVHATAASIRKLPEDILAFGQTEAEREVTAASDQYFTYKPQSAFANPVELSDEATVQIPNTGAVMHYETPSKGLVNVENPGLNNSHTVASKKAETRIHDANLDIKQFLQQADAENRFGSSKLESGMKSTKSPQQKAGIKNVNIKVKTEVKLNNNGVDEKQDNAFSVGHTEKAKQFTPVYNIKDSGSDLGKIRHSPDIKDKGLNTNNKQPAVKKYKINFTSLPELLEDETLTLPVTRVDQIAERRGENGEAERDNYIMDLNVHGPSTNRHKMRPKTEKPPTSGEILHKSIKTLKAVRFQTHAPVQWYVTAQSILRNAAINRVLPVKASEKTTHDNISNIGTVNSKKMNGISLTRIPISDTKLRDVQRDLILNTAGVNKRIDDSSDGGSQAKEAFDQREASDVYNKKRDNKNKVILLQSSKSANEIKNNGGLSSRTLDKQFKEHNHFNNNITSTRQPLKSSNKKSSFIKQGDSIQTDTKLQKSILQPNGGSNDIQEYVDISQYAQPSEFPVETKYGERIKTDTSTQFKNSVEELNQYKEDSIGHSLEKSATVKFVDPQQVVDKIDNTPYKIDNGQAGRDLERTIINNKTFNISTTRGSHLTKAPYTNNPSITTAAQKLFTDSNKTENGAKIGTQSRDRAVDRTSSNSFQTGATNASSVDILSERKYEHASSAFRDKDQQSSLSVEQIQSNRDTQQKPNNTLKGKQKVVDQEIFHGEISIQSLNGRSKVSLEQLQDQFSESNFISNIRINENEQIRPSYEDVKPLGQAYTEMKITQSVKEPVKNNHVSAAYNIKTANDASIKAPSIGLSNPSNYHKGNNGSDFQNEKTHTSSYVANSKTKLPNVNTRLTDHIVNNNNKETNVRKDEMSKHVPGKSEAKNNSLLKTDMSNKNIVGIVALQDVRPKQQIRVAGVPSFNEKKQNKIPKGGMLYDDTENLVNGKYDQPRGSKSETLSSVQHGRKPVFGPKTTVNSLQNKTNLKAYPSKDNTHEKAGETIANVSKDTINTGANTNVIQHNNPQMPVTSKASNLTNTAQNAFTKDIIPSKTYRQNTSGEVAKPQHSSTTRPPFIQMRTSVTKTDANNKKTQRPDFSKSPSGKYTTVSPTKVSVETQLSAASNGTVRDPFEMMSLFMAKQNILEAILKVQRKQTTTIQTPISKTLVSKSASLGNSNTKLPNNITVASKTSSNKTVSPFTPPSTGSPSRNATNGKGKTSVDSIKLNVDVRKNITKQGFIEEKRMPKSTVEPETKRYATELRKTTQQSLSSVSPTSTITSSTQTVRSTEKMTRSGITKRLTGGKDTTFHITTRVKTTKPAMITKTTQRPTTRTPIKTSISSNAKNLNNRSSRLQYQGERTTTIILNQINANIRNWEYPGNRLPVLGPNFDQNGTKIVYSPGRPHSDETSTSRTIFNPVYYPPASMNTLPEHGFVLHTQSSRDSPGKSTKQRPDGLPLPKISRTENGFRRHSIYREMNLDKFRSYVNAIRNYPTVKVPYRGLYRPEDQANAALDGAEVARLPQPGRRYGTFYSSVSSVGAVFTRYWPAVLGVSVGTIFLVTALVTSILCRQRRILIQRVRWSDSPQHVTEPPDTSEYTSSSEASLASDLTRSSIHLV